MLSLDKQVIQQTRQWLTEGHTVWLCTVLASYGSSPREPGSMMVAMADNRHLGSLSGGCVEEDFLQRVARGDFEQQAERIHYGADTNLPDCNVTLPCGGTLEILVERLQPSAQAVEHLTAINNAITQHQFIGRRVNCATGEQALQNIQAAAPRIRIDPQSHSIDIALGPVARLIIAGVSPVSVFCSEYALSLGFEVIVCDPEPERWATTHFPNVQQEHLLPSEFIARANAVHKGTAIVALTHDPRIDDLAMLEAIHTQAFYIGVMGSHKTSRARAERLQRIGHLSDAQLQRIHMPIGLALGSKTPAEIALAVMADVLRVQRGIGRHEL